MPRSFHVSQNCLEGSLCDTSMDRLLESCREHQITGTIKIDTPFQKGVIELRAGFVDEARFGDLRGDHAVRRLKRLSDGMYTLTQQLPDLSGSLGSAAAGEGYLDEIELVTILRHCEDQALSCTITVVAAFDRAEIVYRGGEIAEVKLNGERDDDAIVSVLNWTEGRFRISAPPLALDIDGWPKTKDPTAPFHIAHASRMRAESSRQPSRPSRTPRGTPPPLPGLGLNAADPNSGVEPEKTTIDNGPPVFDDEPTLDVTPEDFEIVEVKKLPRRPPGASVGTDEKTRAMRGPRRAAKLDPAPPRARSTIPGMPLVTEPLFTTRKERTRADKMVTALLAMLCVAVIAAWIGAVYYIQ